MSVRLSARPLFPVKSNQEIPVPCAFKISSYVDVDYVPFKRPECYIKWEDDEVTRVLERGCASYDMDSDDEVWLKKFNLESGFDEPISDDVFELIIGSLEKNLFCAKDNYLDAKAAVDHCRSLGREEVVEAIHSYWIKKRKHKRSALVKVFQGHQSRSQSRSQVRTKSVMGKRRSTNQKASKMGGHKQRAFAQARRDEWNKNILKVQEARVALNRSDDLAVGKRRRAQMLMEIADKSTYKATMALRISEAIGQGKSSTDVAKIILT